MRQFAVIGLGRFGSSVCQRLIEKGQQVLAVDIDEVKVQDVSEEVANAVCIDAADEKALKAVGIENVEVAVVAMGANLESSILITLILKELGVKEIVAKALSLEHKKILEKVGATRVVMPEKEMGVRLANSLISSGVLEYLDVSDEYGIAEVVPPSDFIGKSFQELDVRAKYGLNIIAVKRKVQRVDKKGKTSEVEKTNASPIASTIVRDGDILVVLGKNEDIEKFRAH